MIRAGTPIQHRLDLLVEDLDNGAVLVPRPRSQRGAASPWSSLPWIAATATNRGGNSARKALSALGTGGRNARLDARAVDLDAESCERVAH